jgi:hypothetical protein
MAVDVIMLAQLLERRLQLRGRRLLLECRQLFGGNGTSAREERSFKQLGQRYHD